LRKISDKTYKLDFLEAFDISPIFNFSYLYEFHEEEEDDEAKTMQEWEGKFSIKHVE